MKPARLWTALKRVLFRFGWDTRCRNLDCARLLQDAGVNSGFQAYPTLLDVGCGNGGIASFLSGCSVLGVDLRPPQEKAAHISWFAQSDVTALPFGNQTFPLVSCIDVLEHLSPADRERALKELVRVAGRYLIIACPHGKGARECDAEYLHYCRDRNITPPDWLVEHQEHVYPEAEQVAEQVRKVISMTGRSATLSLLYNEPLEVARIIRRVAARSRLLYVITNIAFGLFYSVLRRPGPSSSYRMILAVAIRPECSE